MGVARIAWEGYINEVPERWPAAEKARKAISRSFLAFSPPAPSPALRSRQRLSRPWLSR